MATNTSSKYDHITCKNLIHSGTPSVYQLKAKKKESGTLKRMTLGEKDPKKKNKTILLVGETGTGKSTLINTLVNYAMGVEWDDNVWFKIVEDEGKSQTRSQTTDVIVYEIFGFEDKTLPYSLTIIDTPGYGDTRGIEHDKIISERLFDWFRSDDGVHEINAVCLVLKFGENRLSNQLRYIFDSMVSLFGKDMEKNIVALITHSDGRTPKRVLNALEAAKIKCAKNEKNQPVHFLYNNCEDEDRTEDTKALKNAYETTTEGMSRLTDFLEKTAPKKVGEIVDVLNNRIRLTTCIKNLQEKIEFIELKQSKIDETQGLLKKHEQDMKDNKNFTINVTYVIKVKEPVDGGRKWWALWLNFQGAVSCKSCEETCHYPCTLVHDPELCKIMDLSGNCTSCKCHASRHVKEKWRYVTKEITEQMTLEDMKEKYEKGKAGHETSSSLLETLKKEKEELQKKKDQLLEESFQVVVKLEKIALKVDSVSTRDHLDFLIKKMTEKGDTEKKKKLEKMKSRVDDDECTTAGEAKKQRLG